MPNKKKKGFKRQARVSKDINSSSSHVPVVRKQWREQQMLDAISSVQKAIFPEIKLPISMEYPDLL